MLFHDPVWGLFGSRAGGRYLTWARVILMVEFMIMMLLNGGDGLHQPFLIATASFAIVTVLILAQLKNHYPACTCVKSP